MYSLARRDGAILPSIFQLPELRISDQQGLDLRKIGVKYIRQKSKTEEIKPGIFYPLFVSEDEEGREVALYVAIRKSQREFNIECVPLKKKEEEYRNGRNVLWKRVMFWFPIFNTLINPK